MGIRGGKGRTRAEIRTLQDFAGHRLTWCNVSLMSLVGLKLKLDNEVQCYTCWLMAVERLLIVGYFMPNPVYTHIDIYNL